MNESDATLIFDGECGFCRRSASWITAKWPVGTRARTIAWQRLDAERLAGFGLTTDDAASAAWWMTDERAFRGHLAVGHALVATGSGWSLVGRTILSRPVRPFAALAYRGVARHRHRLPGGTAACRT